MIKSIKAYFVKSNKDLEMIKDKLHSLRIEHLAKGDAMAYLYGEEVTEGMKEAYKVATFSIIDSMNIFIQMMEIKRKYG